MHVKTLLVLFKAESFSITETRLNKISLDALYHRAKRDAVFVSIDYENPVPESDVFRTVHYSICDTRTKKDIRKGHTIITTRSSAGSLRDVLEISNSAEMSNLKYLLHRDPHVIARLIRELEKRYVRYRPVFSDHPRSDTFFHGLAYALIMQGVADRPKGL